MPRVVVLLATLCALQATAFADDKADKSEAAIREAEALAAAEDFVGAAAKYREAYMADPRVELMCNVGIAFHKAKDLPRAQLFLSHCLKRGTALEATFVAAVRGVLANVEGSLKLGDFTPVDIVVDPEATEVAITTFVADASFVGSHLVWLPYGKHELVFRAEGYIDQTIAITTQSRDMHPLRIKLEKRPAPKSQRVIERRRSKIPAIAATVATVGFILYAGYAYTQAHDRADIAAKAIDETIYDEDTQHISKYNTHLAVASGFAVLSAGASGYLWFRALTPATKVELTTTPTSAAVSFRFRF